MNFIKKIFQNNIDESVHLQFERYGLGNYENKAIVEISKSKNSLKVKTSSEFANEFVKFLAETIKDKTKIDGMIISNNKELPDEIKIEIKGVKQFMGIRKFLINTEINKKDLINALDRFPKSIFLLNFNTDYGSLKIKQKSPKSAKPGKGDDEPKADFCILTTPHLELAKDFLFDYDKDFSKVKIKHTLIIEDLEIPKEFEKDPKLSRIKAIRKGKIKRFVDVDGNSFEKEIKLKV